MVTRVIIEVVCANFSCSAKYRAPAEIRGWIGDGGTIRFNFEHKHPEGWIAKSGYYDLYCPEHAVPDKVTENPLSKIIIDTDTKETK